MISSYTLNFLPCYKKLESQELMMSQISSRTEYLILTDNILVLL